MELGGGLRPSWPLGGEGCGAGIGLEPHMSSQAILTRQEDMSLNLKEKLQVTGGSRKKGRSRPMFLRACALMGTAPFRSVPR